MYQVLIVDDEPVVREVLKGLVSWEALGLTVAGETYNGRKALELAERRHFDLVIADMKMPVMGGIELIRRARRMHPELLFVVLSAYEDYALVREAFRLGALDYLLKSELTASELTTVLEKARTALRAGTGSPAATLRELVVTGRAPEARDLQALFPGLPTESEAKLIVTCVRLVGAPGAPAAGAGFARALESTLKPFAPAVACELDRDELCIVLRLSGVGWREATHQCSRVAETLRAGLSDPEVLDAGCSSLGASSTSLGALLAEARLACGFCFVTGRRRMEEYPRVAARMPADLDGGTRLRRLRDLLSSWDPSAIRTGCRDLQIPDTLPAADQIDEVRSIFEGYYATLAGFAKEPRISAAPGLEQALHRYERRERHLGDLGTLNAWITAALTETASCVRSMGDLVSRTVAYVGRNYPHALDLDDVANAMGVSKGHLCRVFRHQVGSSIMQYRDELRMNRAAELLRTTDLKVYEIAERVGYDNAEHFSKVFKKRKGRSPARFGRGGP